MPDPTSTVPAAIVALRDGLRAVAALAGVTIVAAPQPSDQILPKMIRLLGVSATGDQGYSTIGGRTRRENYAIDGELWYVATDLKGEAAIDAARTVAYTLYGEVERFIWGDPHLGGLVQVATPYFQRDEPTLFDIGTGVKITFQVQITNELRR